MGSFLSNKVNIILILALAVFIAYDVKKHGSFKASKTGDLLAKFRVQCQQAYRWSQKNIPVYIKHSREKLAPYLSTLVEMLTPLAHQIWDNAKLLWQYLLGMKSTAVHWLELNAPGLTDQMGLWLRQAWDYTIMLATLLMKYIILGLQWLRDNVFVGKLSPENLQNYTMKAVNITQTLASQTFSWLNNKVVAISSGA